MRVARINLNSAVGSRNQRSRRLPSVSSNCGAFNLPGDKSFRYNQLWMHIDGVFWSPQLPNLG